MAIVVLGVTIGLIAARWLSHYVATLLFHVETTDSATYMTGRCVDRRRARGQRSGRPPRHDH